MSQARQPPADSAIQDFIRDRLPLAPVPSLPGIRLHSAAPDSGIARLAERDREGFGSPYWAYQWAGGLALARYIHERPETVRDRRILDLGTGSGLVAIAAARCGASAVVAADTDRYAIAALTLNAAANAVAIVPALGDVTTEPPPPVDLVLAGDVFYEPALATAVTAYLDRCLDCGIDVLIGDPGRAPLPRSRLRLIVEYPVSDMGSAATGAVYAFEPLTIAAATHPGKDRV